MIRTLSIYIAIYICRYRAFHMRPYAETNSPYCAGSWGHVLPRELFAYSWGCARFEYFSHPFLWLSPRISALCAVHCAYEAFKSPFALS